MYQRPQLVVLEGEPFLGSDPVSIVGAIVGIVVGVASATFTIIGLASNARKERESALAQAVAQGQAVRATQQASFNAGLEAIVKQKQFQEIQSQEDIKGQEVLKKNLVFGGAALAGITLLSKGK